MKPIITVSYSGLSTYDDCPSRFNRRYVLQEEAGMQPTRKTAPGMFRGTDIHHSIDNCILGNSDTIHPEVEEYTGFVHQLRDLGAKPEHKWAFDREWNLVDFEDTEASIVRGILDVFLDGTPTVTVYEWKTGKEYEDHTRQRALYGLVGLLLQPEAEHCRVITGYLDLKYNRENTYAKSMIKTYKWMWENRINRVQPPQPYPMRPSWKCGGCQFSKKNGGKCPN